MKKLYKVTFISNLKEEFVYVVAETIEGAKDIVENKLIRYDPNILHIETLADYDFYSQITCLFIEGK